MVITPTRVKHYFERNAAHGLYRRMIKIRLSRPIVSFTFDDFPKSALTVGGAILGSHGAKGTYYTSLGLMGKVSSSGSMFDRDDLMLAHDTGHELACHTYDHCHSWNTPTAAYRSSILQNQEELARLLPGQRFESFSYPISDPRPGSKREAGRIFQSCRAGGQRANIGSADLNQLSAFFLEKVHGNLDPLQEVIGANRTQKGWLILATHDVAEEPTPYGCTPSFFMEVVERVIASGASILPVNAALEHIRSTGA